MEIMKYSLEAKAKSCRYVFFVMIVAFLCLFTGCETEKGRPPQPSVDVAEREVRKISKSGYYSLTGTHVMIYGSSSKGKATISVHIGDRERLVYRFDLQHGGAFQTPLGFVEEGESIYFSVSNEINSEEIEFLIEEIPTEAVAQFQSSFQSQNQSNNWRYMSTVEGRSVFENAVSNPALYSDLSWDGEQKFYGRNGLNIDSLGGSLKDVSLHKDDYKKKYYAISSYTVDKPGYYAITNSWLKRRDAECSEELEVLIHVDDRSPILREFVGASGSIIDFDTDVAYLEAGASIFVCVGASVGNDAKQFSMDYQIVRVEGAKSILEQIKAANGSNVRLFPTRYYPERVQIDLRSKRYFTVNGYGVSYLQTNKDARFITLVDCANVKVLGLTMDYDPILFFQGDILDIESNQITFRPHRGYAIPDPAEAPYNTKTVPHDPETMRWRPETTISIVKNVKQVDEHFILEVNNNPLELNWEIGDYMTWYRKGVGSPVLLSRCQDVVLKDVTMHQYCNWGVSSMSGIRNTFDNVRLTPGPKPLLANIKRLRAGDKDGINLPSPESPTIKNCLIEANCDDAIHIWGKLYIALQDSNNSRTVQVAARANELEEGMQLYIQTSRGRESRIVTGVEKSDLSPEQVGETLKSHYPKLNLKLGYLINRIQVQLDKPVTLAEGDFMYIVSKTGKNMSITNNIIRNNPGRGMVIKSIDGVIEGNHVSYMGGQGIKVEVEAEGYGTGGFSENLLIRNNHFKEVAAHTIWRDTIYKAGAIQIHCTGRDLMRFDGIQIVDNVFEDIYGVNVIITDATNVVLEGNHFINPGRLTSEAGLNSIHTTVQDAVVWSWNVEDVIFDSDNKNEFSNKSPNVVATHEERLVGN